MSQKREVRSYYKNKKQRYKNLYWHTLFFEANKPAVHSLNKNSSTNCTFSLASLPRHSIVIHAFPRLQEHFELRQISYLKSSHSISINGPCPTGVIRADRSSLLCSFEDRNEHPEANPEEHLLPRSVFVSDVSSIP